MSQLQVTGEAKIRDLQGPVVANSGVITALDGAANQYVRGDGTLASFPTSSGGGSSVSYYLNGSVNQGTFGGSTYYQMSKNAITGTGTNFSTSSNGLIAQFITDANDPDVVSIPSGNWNVEFFMGVSASSGSLASFYVEIYKYNGSTFTLLATNVATPEFLTNTTTVDAYFTSVAMPLSAMAITDRLAVRIYANVASKTVTLYTEDNRLCQVVTTFSKGILSINGLTDQSQNLTVGTAGTDFNIVSALDTHTFNIPSASATNRGLITTGTQTIAGAKTFSSTATFNTGGVFNNWGISLYDGAGSTALSSSTLTGIYASKSGSITDIVISHNAPYDSILRFSNDVANFTYTFPDLSGTIALLEGTQTFTGIKTFNLSPINETGIQLKNDIGIVPVVSGYTNLNGLTNGLAITNSSGVSNNLLVPATTGYSYTFPSASGTLALLEGSQTFTGAKTFSASVVNDDGLKIKFGSASNLTANYLTLSAYGLTSPNRTVLRLGTTATTLSELYFSQLSSYQYTFPDASGTLALTSNITSAINGTSTYIPVFTGANSIGNSQIWNNGGIIGMGTNYSSPSFSVVASSGDTVTQGKLAINTTSFSGTSVLQVNGTTQSTGYFLTGMTAGSGALYYNAGANRVTLANYNASGILTFEVNGGATALTIASTGAATFSSNVIAPQFYANFVGAGFRGIEYQSSGTIFGYSKADAGGGEYRHYIGPSGGWGGYMTFYTDNSERMGITSGGNVGIGTSSPGNFSGVGFTGPFLDIAGILQIKGTSSNGLAAFQLGGDTYRKALIYTPVGTDTPYLAFGVATNGSSSSANEAMRITSGGNLLVGTTTDVGQKFVVNGGVATIDNYLTMRSTVNSTNYGFINEGTGLIKIAIIGVQNSAQINMATGVYTPLSDSTKKKDFEASTIGLKEVLQLKPTLYRMKTDDTEGSKELGFIAQEVKEFIPQAFVQSGDFIGLNFNAITASNTKAIQEIYQLVLAQNAKIEELKALIAAK